MKVVMKVRFNKESGLLFLAVLCVVVNTSAFLGYQAERLIHGYFKYVVSIVTICIMLLAILKSRSSGSRGVVLSVQLEWIFLALYAGLYLLQHQILEDNSGKAFGLSSYTMLGFQNIATFMIGSYVVLNASEKFCKRIVFAFFFITIVDCVMSLSVLAVNDQALRISSWQTGEGELAEQGLFGICNALHVYAFVTMLPVLIMLVNQGGKLRYWAIAVIATILVLVVSAGYTMAIALMVVYCGYKVFCRLTRNNSVRVIGTMLIIAAVVFVDWPGVFLSLADKTSNASVRERFLDLYKILATGEQGAAIGSRISSYTRGLEGFVNSPVIGNVLLDTRMVSNHSTLIDILSDWGIIGFSFYMLFIRFLSRSGRQYALQKNRKYYHEAILLYVVTIILNTLGRYANGSAVVAIMLPAAVKFICYDNARVGRRITTQRGVLCKSIKL